MRKRLAAGTAAAAVLLTPAAAPAQGADAPALALAAGGVMLVAGTALAGRAARARA